MTKAIHQTAMLFNSAFEANLASAYRQLRDARDHQKALLSLSALAGDDVNAALEAALQALGRVDAGLADAIRDLNAIRETLVHARYIIEDDACDDPVQDEADREAMASACSASIKVHPCTPAPPAAGDDDGLGLGF